jgi:hypothetical protein
MAKASELARARTRFHAEGAGQQPGHRHDHLLAARSRGLSFCRLMVRAGQARRLLAESSVPGAVRQDGPFIR